MKTTSWLYFVAFAMCTAGAFWAYQLPVIP